MGVSSDEILIIGVSSGQVVLSWVCQVGVRFYHGCVKWSSVLIMGVSSNQIFIMGVSSGQVVLSWACQVVKVKVAKCKLSTFSRFLFSLVHQKS